MTFLPPAVPLKAPFPYFGGKRRVAGMIWERLGDPNNVIEPFAGSAAFLLARPHPPRIETINDADCMVANFWRATSKDPEAVAGFADGPVNEADLHARHRWLVLSDEAKAFRARMRTDPEFYDAKVAGWWCWGACCWIGSGWCGIGAEWEQPPRASDGTNGSYGVHAMEWQLNGPEATHNKRPHVPRERGDGLAAGKRVPGLREKKPYCDRGDGRAIHGRPQFADAYDVGRGVNSNADLGTCAARRAWLVDWFGRLRDRLRLVRVCCGDWKRVCGSDSVTVRLGTTGIFFDPPYSAEAGRDMNLYAVECGKVAHEVRAYCLERGGDPRYRIALAGYAGEGHEELGRAGWECVPWRAQGGYGNRSAKGKANADRERLWFSPHCLKDDRPRMADLFAGAG